MCVVCKTLTSSDLETIQVKVMSSVDPEDIAVLFGVSFQDMQTHCTQCIKRPSSRFEKLMVLIENLVEDVDTARAAYQVDAENSELAQAYAALVRELRTTIESAQGLVKPDEQVTEIVDKVVNPLLLGLVHDATDEMGKFRNELLAQGVSEEIASRLCKSRLVAIGQRINRRLQEAVESLGSYLGVDSKRVSELATERVATQHMH
jgi:hypothetical protein